ncbi:MAG TPA: DUF5606 domain-containing protein [Flavisolibacter sp.]|jgi:hypothetical protein|nr:DUF5606 domain-containing protein [Flavisolibacter sp.]
MEYNRIVAVTGLSGLFEVVSSKNDGALVRSLEDGSTKFVSSRVHNLSHLESIEIFTEEDNVNLADVFEAMKSSGDALPEAKDNGAVRSYFEKVYPKMDFERVYASDMKKIVKWYEVLQSKGIEIKLTSQEGEEVAEAEDEGSAEAAKTEDITTLEVSGMDTAETAKPKKTRKKKSEE